MKTIVAGALLALAAAGPTLAADVGVSVSIGDPNFYGHIEIGDYPRPRLIYAEPVVIERVHVVHEPAYLHVPPGHAKNWGKHCHKYHACARPVYFVESGWYEEVYVPAHHAKHKGGKGHGKHHGKGKGKHKD